jgi:hypothetical protein
VVPVPVPTPLVATPLLPAVMPLLEPDEPPSGLSPPSSSSKARSTTVRLPQATSVNTAANGRKALSPIVLPRDPGTGLGYPERAEEKSAWGETERPGEGHSKESAVDAEPPRIVLEHPERCSDGDRAADLLRQALAPARAPAAGWVVTMHVQVSPARAEADIVDAAGNTVGRRILPRKTTDCSGAARAVGVWASLVLDAERQRAKRQASPLDGAPPPAEAGAVPPSPVAAGEGASSSSTDAPWPAPEPDEKPPPEADWYLHHDEKRSVEIGAGAFLLTGTVGGALVGPTLFVVVEAGRGVFLRPSLSAGQTLTSLPTSGPHSEWIAPRFDACLRLPGFYSNRHGIQLDGCAGADGGISLLDNTGGQIVPYIALGPSVDLRGELGQLAVAVRGIFGVNIVRSDFTDNAGNELRSSLWTGRLELAFSWSAQ